MLIDPFVIIAQIINFLILVALLKRFLYKPITDVMETRSQRIKRQLATAELMEKNANLEKELYLKKQQDLETQKQAWLEEAKQEVEQEKKKLRKNAQAEVNLMRSQWYETLERDKSDYSKKLRNRLTQQVAVTTRKALVDLANANLETQTIDTFIDRLYNLDDSQIETIRTAPIPNPHHIITIRSSYIIPSDRRDRLIKAVREQIATNAEVKFETREDIICGIELRDRGYKIAWNLEHYLAELEIATVKVISENNK